MAKADAYNTTMYIMAGLFVVGLICNFLVKPVDQRFHMKAGREGTALGVAAGSARA